MYLDNKYSFTFRLKATKESIFFNSLGREFQSLQELKAKEVGAAANDFEMKKFFALPRVL